MCKVQALRQESDSRALVLLDEVGTGTDPVEGAALGAAILKALVKGGARGAALTFATTHHRCLPCDHHVVVVVGVHVLERICTAWQLWYPSKMDSHPQA